MTGIITEYIEDSNYIPAPCQGVLGIECKANDSGTIAILKKIDNPKVKICVDAERKFISTLGMGCHTPVGAIASIGRGGINFKAFAAYGKDQILEKNIHSAKENILKAVRELAIHFRVQIDKYSIKKE